MREASILRSASQAIRDARARGEEPRKPAHNRGHLPVHLPRTARAHYGILVSSHETREKVILRMVADPFRSARQ